MDNIEARVATIMQDVLAYLARHPTASDTVEGIARWWLSAAAPASEALVQLGLDRLAAAGRLRRTVGRDGAVRYSAGSA